MSEVRKIVLENSSGKVIRTFALKGSTAHVVQRKDNKRLELMPHPEAIEALRKEKIEVNELGQIDLAKLGSEPFKLASIGIFKEASDNMPIVTDLKLSQEASRKFERVLSGLIVVAVIFLMVAANIQLKPNKNEEIKQQIVQIVKKIPKKTVTATQSQTNTEVKTTAKVSLRRMGALGILGSLSKSNQKGGLNLGAVQTTAGPGLGGTGGSGGVQTNIYAKGLVAAPLGAGGNLQGGGGYGTKGKGGGQAGYGKLSIVGSNGTSSIPLSSEASVGGGLDKDLIGDVINRNLGQIRFCYEQGLQGDPGLHGRVAVGFTINANGAVQSAQIDSTSLNSKLVEDCIVLRLRSWKFPLPEGGKEVKVSYPFVLRRQGQG